MAGPVYAAAVVLPLGIEIDGLNDSKKLTEKKREVLFDVIREVALDYSIGVATEKEIDEIFSMLLFSLCIGLLKDLKTNLTMP